MKLTRIINTLPEVLDTLLHLLRIIIDNYDKRRKKPQSAEHQKE